ncbi:KamA family radical SAM protein [Desulfogranum mediterraneum]|uniref:KamA family radical SAM protein n=1 Tax=Desulfogranum mediterraneum TaxID=160661 RepID=UPI00040232E0|nr:KamA family radical SAM protein [Desulfogranum mediterraneum]
MSLHPSFHSGSITCPEQLSSLQGLDLAAISRVAARYPLRISGYYFRLMQEVGAPLIKQVIPDSRELNDPDGLEDPLDEENLSPVPNLVHKYPDRALFLVSSECAMYCRFCTRKRKVGTPTMSITDQTIAQGLDYLARTPAIKDVLVSGGDPLMLSDQRLERILKAIRAIPSVVTIRIGTRMPCSQPMRITPRLAGMLKKYHPLYLNTHFNHPAEITPQATRACGLLADAGIPLGCQTVLLRGVNDRPEVIKALIYSLLEIRVKPYYLFQADQTRGTSHFRTTIQTGQAIMRHLIGHVSGMAIPTYALDAPGGGGKIPLTPEYIDNLTETLDFTTYLGKPCSYPNTIIG